jgi:general stress protein YciG
MAGTRAGGLKASLKVKELYGKDYFAKIGSKGGKKGTTGGFYANRELARLAGAKGGKLSKRGLNKLKVMENDNDTIN